MIRFFILFCLAASICSADQASHRKAASQLLEQAGGAKLFIASTDAMLEPIVASWRQQGIDEELIPVMTRVLREWCAEDLAWSELEPRIVDVYIRHFTEAELKKVAKFYRTPVGKKALAALPVVMAEAASVGTAFAQEKQGLLQARLEKAMKDRQPASSEAQPGATDNPDDAQHLREDH